MILLQRGHLYWKLLALLLIPLTVFLITTLAAIVRFGYMTDDIQRLYRDTTLGVQLIRYASNNMNQALVAQRTLIFTDYKSKKYQSIYDDYKRNVRTAIENTEKAKAHLAGSTGASLSSSAGANRDVLDMIDAYSNAFDQWQTRSNTIIESMSTRGLTGEHKLAFQGLILDEAMAADEKFETAGELLLQIERILAERSDAASRDIARSKRDVQTYLMTAAGVTFAVACALSLWLSRSVTVSIKQLVQFTKRVARGDLATDSIQIRSKDEIGLLAASFISMCERLREYIEIVYVSKLREKEAELRALQLQIHPHFLFNTLEVIRMKLVRSGEREVSGMVKILADIYRWNVKGRHRIVSLEEELEYTLSYVKLQEIRFRDRLRVEADIDADLLQLGIPKLVLQPLLENAIAHGFANKSAACEIRIAGRRDGDDLVIDCADNGEGMDGSLVEALRLQLLDKNPESDNIGLRNVHSRIALLFGSPYGVSIRSAPGEGTTVSIRLPAKFHQEMKAQYV
ncbi:sensor histidine kinase [Paenibacillus sp.]|uniref:sensor histidine kinase n=1 Tax=Paenibacillus sp. TaxID=58172 RepID=UPI002D5D79D5|nr:sensor histidine kinase [Paenibacillus sp.]HZG87187.1 sensor histidine kinase [Paenibacillus sp.]